jgi:hypothetical protein
MDDVIEDTGPGYHAGPGAPFAAAIEEATEESHQVQQTTNPETTGSNGIAKRTVPVKIVPDSRPVHQEQGEGIGLSIVKRLCELLDAALEIESSPGRGTVFRVIFAPQAGSGCGRPVVDGLTSDVHQPRSASETLINRLRCSRACGCDSHNSKLP